jgi:hypothetical protein
MMSTAPCELRRGCVAKLDLQVHCVFIYSYNYCLYKRTHFSFYSYFFVFKKQICFWVCWKGNDKLLNCALHLGLVFRTEKVGAKTTGPLKKVKSCALLVGKGKIRVLPNG